MTDPASRPKVWLVSADALVPRMSLSHHPWHSHETRPVGFILILYTCCVAGRDWKTGRCPFSSLGTMGICDPRPGLFDPLAFILRQGDAKNNHHSQIEGIILAAGLSTRMGVPKLTLEIEGIPIIRRVVRAALESELHRVILVIGPSDSG